MSYSVVASGLVVDVDAWRDTARLAIGGGFRASRVGELVIGRAGVILKSDKVALDLVPIRWGDLNGGSQARTLNLSARDFRSGHHIDRVGWRLA